MTYPTTYPQIPEANLIDLASGVLVGRSAAGVGVGQQITLGAHLAFVGTVLDATGFGIGTVTSVALTLPAWLTVSGSPVTGAGTLAVTAATGQTANRFLATPDGSAGAVSLRAFAVADLGTILDTDGTLAANSDLKLCSQKAVRTFVENIVTGLLDLKGDTDCSASPNYPAASKADAYYVTVAGKIGGAAGKSVDVGDVYVAKADNAGGTEAGVGTSWFVLEHNLVGALLTANALSELAGVAATARGNIGAAASGVNTDLTSILLSQTGLAVKGASANALTVKPNETLSAARTLNLKVNDADRTVDLSGNLTVTTTITLVGASHTLTLGADATVSGSNTGDQTLPVGANPTASIGAAAVNGTAATFMRSDGAPALAVGTHLSYSGGSLVTDAASANTAGTLVARDGSGNFEAGTINKITLTPVATGSTLTLADGKALTVSHSLTFTGAAFSTSTVTFGAGGTVAYLGTVQTFTAGQNILITDTATNTTGNDPLTLTHNTSGTPAAGFGTTVAHCKAQSSTTTGQDIGQLEFVWTDATHASRTSAFHIQLVNNAGAMGTVCTVSAAGNVTATTFTGTLVGAAPAGSLSGTTLSASVLGATQTWTAVQSFSGSATTSSTSAAALGGTKWRMQQTGGDETNAGVLDYRNFDASAVSLVGAGTTTSNRCFRVFDRFGVGVTPTVPVDVLASTAGAVVAQFKNSANASDGYGVAVIAGSNSGSATGVMIFNRPDGTQIGTISQATATTVAYNTSSDERIKENIADLTGWSLDDALALRPRVFTYRRDPQHTPHVGFVAQELALACPQAVTVGGADPFREPWGVDQSQTVAYLWKTVQDLIGLVRTQAADIAALKAKVGL